MDAWLTDVSMKSSEVLWKIDTAVKRCNTSIVICELFKSNDLNPFSSLF